jgi:DNA-binding NarL/FixJ family response regulator
MTAAKEDRVLVAIADHSGFSREMLRRILKESGSYGLAFETSKAEHVVGLVMGASPKPQILIMNPRMPSTSFWEVLECLQALDEPPQVLVLVDPGSKALATEACARGAVHYIVKPIDPAWVVDTLARVVSGEYQAGYSQKLMGAL